MIHSDRVVRDDTQRQGSQGNYTWQGQRRQNTHSDRAVRESTHRQSSQGKYKVTEQLGKVHNDRAVREVHNDRPVGESTQ